MDRPEVLTFETCILLMRLTVLRWPWFFKVFYEVDLYGCLLTENKVVFVVVVVVNINFCLWFLPFRLIQLRFVFQILLRRKAVCVTAVTRIFVCLPWTFIGDFWCGGVGTVTAMIPRRPAVMSCCSIPVSTIPSTLQPQLSVVAACSTKTTSINDNRSTTTDQSAICSIATLQKINYSVTCPRIFSSFLLLLLLSWDVHDHVDD